MKNEHTLDMAFWHSKGLTWCTVCGGAEATMPTECPGKMIHADAHELISLGKLDYRRAAPNMPPTWWIALTEEKIAAVIYAKEQG